MSVVLEPRKIGDELKAFLGRSRSVKRSRRSRELADLWNAVAGPEVAARTHARGARLGILTIAVDSPPLCHELASFRRADLLARINARLPAGRQLKDLYFRHGPS